MSGTPWEVLGLDAEDATPQSVRRAYARLLKIHRPDADPEGFRHLHAAYEAAITLLNARPALKPPLQAPEEPVSTSPLRGWESLEKDPTPPSVPKEIAAAFARLEQALEARDEAITPLLREVENVLARHPQFASQWSERMSALLEHYKEVEVLELRAETIVLELSQDLLGASLFAVERMDRFGKVTQMEALREKIWENRKRLEHRSAAILAMRLACALTVWGRGDQDRLLDFAYPHLGAHRDQYLAVHRENRRLAELLDCLAGNQRIFWRQRLENPDLPTDWESPEAKSALRDLCSEEAHAWPGRRILASLVPFELDLKSPSKIRKIQPAIPKKSRRGFPSLAGVFAAVLIQVGRLITQSHEDYSSRTIPTSDLKRISKEEFDARPKKADPPSKAEQARMFRDLAFPPDHEPTKPSRPPSTYEWQPSAKP